MRAKRQRLQSLYLLEHLVDIGQHRAMKVAVSVHLEAVSKATACHFQGDIFNGLEFGLDLLVGRRKVAECSQDVQSLVFATLQHQPTRTLGKTRNQSEDEESENDLESNGEAPGDTAGFEEREAEIEPVTQHDTKDNHRTLNHDHLASAMRLRRFRLPCWNRTCVHAVAETGDPASDDELGKTE